MIDQQLGSSNCRISLGSVWGGVRHFESLPSSDFLCRLHGSGCNWIGGHCKTENKQESIQKVVGEGFFETVGSQSIVEDSRRSLTTLGEQSGEISMKK